MKLIKCDGCNAVYDLSNIVCPGCGLCPGCGKRRIGREEFEQTARCQECEAPYCSGCGRCHACGALRFQNYPPCECGFPVDEEKVRSVESSFGIDNPKKSGCIGVLTIAIVILSAGWLFAARF